MDRLQENNANCEPSSGSTPQSPDPGSTATPPHGQWKVTGCCWPRAGTTMAGKMYRRIDTKDRNGDHGGRCCGESGDAHSRVEDEAEQECKKITREESLRATLN